MEPSWLKWISLAMAFGFRAEEEEGLLGSDGLLVLKEIAEIE